MKFLGHSAHQLLIVFPVGLLMTSLVFDVIALSTGSSQFWTVAYYLLASGLIGGVVAAVFGVLDYRHIPGGTRANRIAVLHGVGNATVMVLFFLSWWMRPAVDMAAPTSSLVLSVLGAALLGVTGWMGGELVARLSVGVDEKAHIDAPNSLKEHGVVEATTSYHKAA